MSGWSKTTKPSADTTIADANIFGVDANEIAVTPGPQHIGWVHILDSAGPGGVGTRQRFETLVAMKEAPTEDNADDTVLPDTVITITAQPAAATANLLANASATASFTVTATASPTATLTYLWQVSTNGGTSYAAAPNGAVYSGNTTTTLVVLAPTGLDNALYRAVVTGTNTGVTATTTAAELTVIE